MPLSTTATVTPTTGQAGLLEGSAVEAGIDGEGVVLLHDAVLGDVLDEGQGGQAVKVARRQAHRDRVDERQALGDVAVQRRDLGLTRRRQGAVKRDDDGRHARPILAWARV